MTTASTPSEAGNASATALMKTSWPFQGARRPTIPILLTVSRISTADFGHLDRTGDLRRLRDGGPVERLQGGVRVGDHLVGEPVDHRPHQPRGAGGHVVGREAGVQVPDDRDSGEARRHGPVHAAPQRVDVHEVRIQLAQAPGEPHGGRGGRGGAADDLQPHPDSLPAHRPGGPERKHLRGDAFLAQAELERALLAEDHMRIDVDQRAEVVEQADLRPGELGAVAQEHDPGFPRGRGDGASIELAVALHEGRRREALRVSPALLRPGGGCGASQHSLQGACELHRIRGRRQDPPLQAGRGLGEAPDVRGDHGGAACERLEDDQAEPLQLRRRHHGYVRRPVAGNQVLAPRGSPRR